MTIVVAVLSVCLYIKVPKGFFPQQDTGRIQGAVIGCAGHLVPIDEPTRCSAMSKIVMKDPAVDTMVGFAGGSTSLNQGRFFMMLKPLEERGPCKKQHFWEACQYVSADDVINRLARQTGGGSRRNADSAVGAGTHDRGTVWQRAISVHAAERKSGRIKYVGATSVAEA